MLLRRRLRQTDVLEGHALLKTLEVPLRRVELEAVLLHVRQDLRLLLRRQALTRQLLIVR